MDMIEPAFNRWQGARKEGWQPGEKGGPTVGAAPFGPCSVADGARKQGRVCPLTNPWPRRRWRVRPGPRPSRRRML